MCSGLERWGVVYPSLDAMRWFGDGSSKTAVSALLCGGVATVTQVRGGSRRRGCTGNGHSPGGTLVARKVDSSPGEKCVAKLGFPRASHTPGEKCVAELAFPRASHTPGER